MSRKTASNRKLPPDDRLRIDLANGLSWEEMGMKYGISRGRVATYCKEAGLIDPDTETRLPKLHPTAAKVVNWRGHSLPRVTMVYGAWVPAEEVQHG